jgi:serine/threonine protein kinase
VALYDHGQTSDGIEYYTMELVDGLTLHELVQRDGPPPAARALGLLRQIAASLAEAAHLREPPLPPSLRTAESVPADLEDVLMRCLEKRPEQRYAHARSLLRALEACAGDRSWSAADAELWWRAWRSDAPAPRRVPPSPSPEVTRLDFEPLSTRPFALRPR